VLYDHTLSAGAYQRWLRLMGRALRLLPNAALDPVGAREADLLRSGRSGLREISISKDFRAFELPDATPLLTLGAARRIHPRWRAKRACCARRASILVVTHRSPARIFCACITRPTGASTTQLPRAVEPARME